MSISMPKVVPVARAPSVKFEINTSVIDDKLAVVMAMVQKLERESSKPPAWLDNILVRSRHRSVFVFV
jgi:hypothetical protein